MRFNTPVKKRKQPITGFATGLSDIELRSAVLLAILSFIVYPVLPAQPVGPYGLVQLQETWATVLLIAALGFVNYVLWKIYGPRSISAYGPPPDDTSQIIGVMDRLVKAIEEAAGPRLIVVGGAASLFVAPGVTVRQSGHLPKEWIPIVDAHIQVLRNLKQSNIDWTYFSPAAFFEPGERKGKFRLGKDDLITDAQGNSRISFEDYAIALVDELENPQHHRERFTIGY
jgi:NAD(P)H-binding